MIPNQEYLHNQEIWIKELIEIKTKISKKYSDELIKDEEIAKTQIINLITDFIESVNEGYVILFSGGIDSLLLALLSKRLNKNFCLLSMGYENSTDIIYSREFIKQYKFNYEEKIISEQDVLEYLKKAKTLLTKKNLLRSQQDLFNHHSNIKNTFFNYLTNPTTTIELATFELMAFENSSYDLIMMGTGAEEIFAGYNQHLLMKKNNLDINEESWKRLLYYVWDVDIKRISLLENETKKKVILPFFDLNLIETAMSIDDSLKIKEEYRKYILSKILLDLGMRKEFAFRKKKASQYGSGIDSFVEKISKKNGFKYKKEFIESLK